MWTANLENGKDGRFNQTKYFSISSWPYKADER